MAKSDERSHMCEGAHASPQGGTRRTGSYAVPRSRTGATLSQIAQIVPNCGDVWDNSDIGALCAHDEHLLAQGAHRDHDSAHSKHFVHPSPHQAHTVYTNGNLSPLVYIAGPYTHPHPAVRNHRVRDSGRVALHVMRLGACAIDVRTMWHQHLGKVPESDILDYCTTLLAMCDALLLTGEWRASKGAMLEHEVAKSQHMQIFDYNVAESKSVFTMWATENKCA